MIRLRFVGLLLASLWLAGCSSTPYSEGYPTSVAWSLLPVINHSADAEAATLTQQALQAVLSEVGLNASLAPAAVAEGSNNLLSSASLLAQAKEWSAAQEIPLGLSAVVDQWQVDAEDRGQLGLTLKVLDTLTGQPLWTTEGQATGNPGQAPEELLPQLLTQLVGALPLAQ